MACSVMVPVCSYTSKDSNNSLHASVSVHRCSSMESTYSTFTESKDRSEEREFEFAKRLLFDEDLFTKEIRQQAREYAKVSQWCKRNGYQDIITPKRTYRGTTKFALHTAVKQHDLDMVRLLLKLGATKDARNSSGKTARQLAESISEGDLRDEMLDALRV